MTRTIPQTTLFVGSLALLGFGPAASLTPAASPLPVYPSWSTSTPTMSPVPLYFEANRGQTAPEVKFLARARGYTLLLTSSEALVTMTSASTPLRIKFVGAKADPQVIGFDQLPGKANYLLGARTSWHTNIPTYARIEYRELYSGIDLAYHAEWQQLEYDFIVGAGANPGAIALEFDGARSVELTSNGDLLLHTASGIMRHAKPVAYQQIGSGRRLIESRYVLKRSRQVGFELGVYDVGRPVVIDPTLAFSSYLGGSGGDGATGVAVDSAGNIYFTGTTGSLDFPTANAVPLPGGNAVTDAFVAKVSADGSTLLYATYFGGNNDEEGLDIAVDAAGNVYICGMTESADFPTQNAIQPAYGGGDSDGFVARIDVAGDAFVYATYLGGSGHDRAGTLAFDGGGHTYVAGGTGSADFPTEQAFQRRLRGEFDAFVTKLSPTGTAFVYSTYLGGVEERGSSLDAAHGIAVNATGNAYVVGATAARSFPTRHAFQQTLAGASDAFITKLAADGRKLVYSTFLGGAQPDSGLDIALDAADRATVVGHTSSTDFPTVAPLQAQLMAPEADLFVAQFAADGAQLRFSTYLGGTGGDFPASVALDAAGNIHITGLTGSLDFPLAAPIQSMAGGGSDAFVTKITPDGAQFVYSTYLGGSRFDTGAGIATDNAGSVYVTGRTLSFDFPVVNALQPAHAGEPFLTFPGFDAFFAKLVP
jgi:hypothetical protein